MAPAIAYARRKLVRRTANLRRQASLEQPLPWTIGDEDDSQQTDSPPRRQRRQADVPQPPADDPFGAQPPGAAPAPPSGPSEAAPEAGVGEDPATSSESPDDGDPFSSESSLSEDEGELDLEDPGYDAPAASVDPSPSQTTSVSPTMDIPLENNPWPSTIDSWDPAVTGGPSSSTSTSSSILFSTLTRTGDAAAGSSNAEPTSTSVRAYPAAPPQISTSTANTVTDAWKDGGESTAVAQADTTPTPQVIRVHEHPHNLSNDAIHGLIAFGTIGVSMGFLAVAWFFWRRAKKRNQPLATDEKPHNFDEPKAALHVQLLAKIPFLKSRFASRAWLNIDEPSFGDESGRENVYQEKSWTQTATAAPRLDSQFFSPSQVMGIAVRVQGGDHAPTVSAHQANDSISSSVQPQRSESRRSQVQPWLAPPARPLSEISSLSSGFGDGIMPPPNGESTLERNMPQTPASIYGGSRRDTVYTEASEDLPPRHRNVGSWVKQQTSRVKRSQARGSDEAPPVPQMPAEEDFRLMLPDGEVPRKVEDSGSGELGVAK